MAMESLAVVSDVFAWYNVVFVACFGVGLFFTIVQVGGLGQGAAEADHDVGHDVNHDTGVGHDADAQPHAEAGTDTDAETDTDADSDADSHAAESIGAVQAFAQFVGIGRVPMSALLMTLFYTVGITGWIANSMLRSRCPSERAMFFTSLALALIAGVITMRLASRLLGTYMPAVLTSALSRRQMIGLVGSAALPIDERFGRAAVKDKYGTLHQVNCRVPSGIAPIPKGTRIVLTKYLPGQDMFLVGRAG